MARKPTAAPEQRAYSIAPTRVRGLPASCPDLEPTPTLAGLAAQGLAREHADEHGRRYFTVSDEGARILSDIARRNGERARAWRDSGSGGSDS